MNLQQSQSTSRSKSAPAQHRDISILVASRNQQDLDNMTSLLGRLEGLKLSSRLISNGHCDPLYNLAELPNILIFRASAAWQQEFEEIRNRPAHSVPPILILADNNDQDMMRSAMQAGARDFYIDPFDPEVLLESIGRLMNECLSHEHKDDATLTAFINAKGGAGASLIAANVAHIMAQISKRQVALIDLDIQFGGLPYYLDLCPKYGLLEAVDRVDELDEVALRGFFITHSSGLQVLASKVDHLEMVDEVPFDKLGKLVDTIAKNCDHVIVDLPRHINLLTTTVLERADQIIIVVQQSLTSLHDGLRLIGFLKRDLGIESKRIQVVVNRYEKKSPISLADIKNALRQETYMTLPNAYKEVSESIENAQPLYKVSKRAPITKALMQLETGIGGCSVSQPGSFGRLVARMRGV